MKKTKSIEKNSWTRLDTDVLILGSGLAGLLLAILMHDQGASVTMVSKETFSDSNTFYAQGGLAAVTSDNHADSISNHLADTIRSGAGLTDAVVAEKLIRQAPYLVQELQRLGMSFDTKQDGSYELAREGGHGKARVLHSKDTTGKAISNSLLETAKFKSVESTKSNFNMIDYCFAFKLIKDGQTVIGAEVLHEGAIKQIFARQTVLATGGAGQIFSRTTNPLIATADGAALAYRAGATLTDLEFMQFHPTALSKPGAPAFLISEAVRGAGAVLLDGMGRPFVSKFHPDGDLATRDVVARAIHSTMHQEGLTYVNLDLRPIGKQNLIERFPSIVETCLQYGTDPLREPIPVCPAAHYFMGGVLADENGCTTLPGLYAIGEVACTGLHGANRLASNSLLEAGVMAINLSHHLSKANPARTLLQSTVQTSSSCDGGVRSSRAGFEHNVPVSNSKFKNDMYQYASLTRSQSGLETLSTLIESNRQATSALNVSNLSAANTLLIGELMMKAAVSRNESRGSHFREDHPLTNDLHFARRQAVCEGNWCWLKPSAEYSKIDKQSARTA